MNVAPALRDVGKDLVMRTAYELRAWGKVIINNKSTRDGDIAHLAIEHGNRCRGVLDKHSQLRLSFRQRLFSPLPLSDVASEALDAQQAPSRSELALSRFLQPHLLTVRPHKSEGYDVRRFARMQFTYERLEALTIFGMNPAEKPAVPEFRS